MPVEIVWFGRTCFRIRGRSVTILTDPCPPESGYRLGKQTASIVTLSRADDPQYSYLAAVQGEPMLLDAPGEYEIGDALITALADRRPDGARNVIFVIELEGVRIAHLGLPPKAPNDTLVEQMDDVDVLLLPVGGGASLGPAAAADVMTSLDPHIAVPMHYKTEKEKLDLEPLERFLRETGAKAAPQPRLSVAPGQVPEELTVVVLEPRG